MTRQFPRMRIGELAERTGISRETIHFYLREGLLPKPKKAGRNMAFYDDGHVERLLLIKRLQNERFLPLSVIKRMLAGKGGADTDLMATLHSLVTDGEPGAREVQLSAAQLERARKAGLESAAELSLLARAVREIGYDFDLALESFALYSRHMAALEREEAELVFARLQKARNPIELVETLRRGRELQMRFLAATRVRHLSRELEDYLAEVERSVALSGGPPAYPLSKAALERLGHPARRKKLLADAPTSKKAAGELVALDYGVGATDGLPELGQKLRARHGELGEIVLYQGAALVDAGEFEAGIGLLKRAAELLSSSALAHAMLGSAWVRRARRTLLEAGTQIAMGEVQAGLAELEKSDDGSPLVRYLRGRVYTSLPRFFGSHERGVADLRAVAAARGDDPVLFRLRANALYFLGLATGERQPLLEAADIDPEGPLAARARERLQGVKP